jgi:hypothetical protein
MKIVIALSILLLVGLPVQAQSVACPVVCPAKAGMFSRR